MKKRLNYYTAFILLFFSLCSRADTSSTHRVSLLTNEQINVWKTIIYPFKNQLLKSHRHEYNRVLIALNDGELKIVNDHGKTHFLKLKKDQAYFLTKDSPDEMHTDENMSGKVIKVIVVELKTATHKNA